MMASPFQQPPSAVEPSKQLAELIEAGELLRSAISRERQREMNIPEVVVVGMQSQGKSELLNSLILDDPDKRILQTKSTKCTKVVTRVTCTQPENETQTNISGGSSLSESGTSRLYNDWSAVVKIKNTQSDITVEEKFFGHNAPARVRDYLETEQEKIPELTKTIQVSIMCYSKDYEYPFTLVDLPGVPNDVSDPATAPAISMIKDHIQELDTGCIVMNVSKAEAGGADFSNDKVRGILRSNIGWSNSRIQQSTIRVFTFVDGVNERHYAEFLDSVMKPEVAKNYPHGTFLIINKADVIEEVFSLEVFAPYQDYCRHDKLKRNVSQLQLAAILHNIADIEKVLEEELKSAQRSAAQFESEVTKNAHSRMQHLAMILKDLGMQLSKRNGYRPPDIEGTCNSYGEVEVMNILRFWLLKQKSDTVSEADEWPKWQRRLGEMKQDNAKCLDYMREYIQNLAGANPSSDYNKNMQLENRLQQEEVQPKMEEACLQVLQECYEAWERYCLAHLEHELAHGSNKVTWQRFPKLRRRVVEVCAKSLKDSEHAAKKLIKETVGLYEYVWEYPDGLPKDDEIDDAKFVTHHITGRPADWDALRGKLLDSIEGTVNGSIASLLAEVAGKSVSPVAPAHVATLLKSCIESVLPQMAASRTKKAPAQPPIIRPGTDIVAEYGHTYRKVIAWVEDFNIQNVWKPVKMATTRAVWSYLVRDMPDKVNQTISDLEEGITEQTLQYLMEEAPEAVTHREAVEQKVRALQDCKRKLEECKDRMRHNPSCIPPMFNKPASSSLTLMSD